MTTRSIVYDDQDTDIIQYSGQWYPHISAEDNVGNFGPPYLHTLHGTNHDANISFEFDGTAVGVYGSTFVVNPQTNPDPNLECFIDGVSIGREPIFDGGENNWKLCGRGGFTAGPHKLEVHITVQSPAQTFWLDQIRYTPSPSILLDDETIRLTNTDPTIRLDSNWRSFGHFNATSQTNATAQVDFFGTSVSWFGYIPEELPHGKASGTYSIDSGQAVNFDLVGLADKVRTSVYNQNFFTTPVVEKGRHTLTVTFLGSNDTTPLTLDYLYIMNSTFAASSSGTSSGSAVVTSVPGATNTHTAGTVGDKGKSEQSIGVLLGSILGGLVLVVTIAGAFLFYRHRRLSPTLHPFKDESGISIPLNYYSHSSIGPRAVPYNRLPTQANQTSSKRGETFRLENRPVKQIRVGPGGAGSQSSTTRGSVGRVHVDSGIRLNEPGQAEDIPPRYTLE